MLILCGSALLSDRLTPDLLHVLRSAGHGDDIVVADCNFPSAAFAPGSVVGKHVVLAGATADEALDAICSVLPLDLFVDTPVHHMVPSDGVELPASGAECHGDAIAAVERHCPGVRVGTIERFAFYEAAKPCFAVVQTAERRPYGCFILKKGVVGPDGNDLGPDSA